MQSEVVAVVGLGVGVGAFCLGWMTGAGLLIFLI